MDTQDTNTNITQELLDAALSDTSVMSYAAFNIDNNLTGEAAVAVAAASDTLENTYASFPILYEPFRTRIYDVVSSAYRDAQNAYSSDSAVMLSAGLATNLMTRQRLAFAESDNATYFGNLSNKGELVIHGGGNKNTTSAEIYNSTVRSGAALRLFGAINETCEGQFILNTAKTNSIGPTLAGYNNGILYWSGNTFNLGGRTLNCNYGTLTWSGTSIKVDAGSNKTPAETGTNNWTGISTTDISSSLILCGGINNTNGGSLALFGASYSDTILEEDRVSSLDGAFSLRTQSVNKSGNNVRRYYFTGYNNGNLYWSGNNIQFGTPEVNWSSIMHSNVSSVVNICSSTSNRTGANIRLYSNKAHYNNYDGTYTPAGIQGGFELCVTDNTCIGTKQYKYRLAGHNTGELLWTGNKFKLNGGTLTYNNTNGNKTLISDIAFRTSKLEFSAGTSTYDLQMQNSDTVLKSDKITGLKLSNNLYLFRSLSAAALNCEMAGNGTLYLRSASDSKYGAYMHLYGANNGAGKFEINTAINTDGTYSNNYSLIGYNYGRLHWTGNQIQFGPPSNISWSSIVHSNVSSVVNICSSTSNRTGGNLRLYSNKAHYQKTDGSYAPLDAQGGFDLCVTDDTCGDTKQYVYKLTGYKYGTLKWSGPTIRVNAGPNKTPAPSGTNNWTSLATTDISSALILCGGINNTNGGSLDLYGASYSDTISATNRDVRLDGAFSLKTQAKNKNGNAVTRHYFTGYNNGILYWSGNTFKLNGNTFNLGGITLTTNSTQLKHSAQYLLYSDTNPYGKIFGLTQNDSYLRIQGGNDTNPNPNGAQLRLGGCAYTGGGVSQGGFTLSTANANGSFGSRLLGYNDGTLKWNDGTPGKYNKHIAGKPTYVNIISVNDTWSFTGKRVTSQKRSIIGDYEFDQMFSKDLTVEGTKGDLYTYAECCSIWITDSSNNGEYKKDANVRNIYFTEEFTKYHQLAVVFGNASLSSISISYIDTAWLKTVIDSKLAYDVTFVAAYTASQCYATFNPSLSTYTAIRISNAAGVLKGIFGVK